MQFGVSESIAHWGRYRPRSPALYYNHRMVNYSELNCLIDRLCHRVAPIAAKRNRIAVATASKLTYLASIVAILRTGRAAVLLNTGLDPKIIGQNVAEAGVVALLVDEQNMYVADHIPSGERDLLDITPLVEAKDVDFEAFEATSSCGPNDEWGVVFSSGSTGVPKGIERSHESMVVELIGWCLELGLTRQTTFYIGRPVYYTGGLVLALSTLLVGGAIILNDFFNDNDCAEVWANYQEELSSRKADWAFFVPDQLRDFTQRAKLANGQPRSARKILVMGAPISGNEKVLAKQYLLSDVVESWGNSESLGTITDPEDLEIRPNSIGRPFLTDTVCVVDDDCRRLPPEEEGWLAGDEEAGFTKYCSRQEDTVRVKRDALIISEDLGYMDQDGYFYIRGRRQESVYIGRTRVFLPEIEDKIRAVTGVEECCLVARKESSGDVSLVALVAQTKESDRDASATVAALNSVLGPSEQLADVVLLNTMPRLPSGKMDRIAACTLIEGQQP